MSQAWPKLPKEPNALLVDLVVQIACLAFLAYWVWILIQPFLIIIVWSVILTVLLDPLFRWSIDTFHMPRGLAALSITILGLIVVLGPATWLALSLVGSLHSFAERLASGDIAIAPPSEAVKHWPAVGNRIYDFWQLASTNLKAALIQVGPQLKPIGSTLLGRAGNAGLSMLKFVLAVVISGFLLLPGPALVGSAKLFLRRITARRGEEFLNLAGATVRNLARGVIGISLLQALLVGIGLIVAGVPAAGLLSFLVLICGIIQIGALIVMGPLIIWSWLTMDTAPAVIFTAYMVPVTLLDNFLRPLVMAHGLKTPMLIILIGVFGGILIHGIVGLFIGPIVLAIAWELVKAWTHEAASE